jgi:GGDEF domain-containing protein
VIAEAPGIAAHLIMHVEDIDDRKALEAELRHLLHDPVDGPGQPRSPDAAPLDAALAQDSCPSCLLFVDLDGFKAVKRPPVHAAGDHVCARLGGDEFVVLCVDTEPHQAEAIADRLRAAVAEPFVVEGRMIGITAAVGVSASDVPRSTCADANGLLRQADERMYEAKRKRPCSEQPRSG